LDALAAGLFHNPGRLQATDSARCDHLETTCRDKFDNLVNHPGWSRHARVQGQDVVLDADEYDTPELDGGLYGRHPRWFATDAHQSLPGEFGDGILILRPSEFSGFVGHWWNKHWPRASVPTGTERIWMEMRVRIIGPAFVQVGIDYWRSPSALYAGVEVNNREAGASDWACGDTEDWQVLGVGR